MALTLSKDGKLVASVLSHHVVQSAVAGKTIVVLTFPLIVIPGYYELRNTRGQTVAVKVLDATERYTAGMPSVHSVRAVVDDGQTFDWA